MSSSPDLADPVARSRLRGGLLLGAQVVLAVVVFLVAARIIDRAAGLPSGSKLSAKLSWLEEHGKEIDLVVFGSSRSAFNVIPEIFDRQAASAGWGAASFNLADHGLQAADIDFVVRQATARRGPGHWRAALIELRPWTGRFINFAEGLQRRQVLTHDAAASFAAVRDAYRHGGRSLAPQAVTNHLLNFGAYVTAAGRGPDLWTTLRRDRPLWDGFEELIDRRGYDPEGGMNEAVTCDWLHLFRTDPETADALSRRISSWVSPELPAAEATADGRGQSNLDAIRHQQDRLLAAGVLPVYYLPAVAAWIPDLEGLGVVRHALVYNDPLRHPSIFEPEARWDCGHLNPSGAEIFSAILGRDVARIVTEVDANAEADAGADADAIPGAG